MLVGFFLTVVCALLSNALIPLFVQNAWTTKLGPLFPGFFILSVAYAIIKHRLFDIRWALARSVAYVLTGATAAAGYLLLILLVSKAFIHDVQISASHQVANLAIALFVGLTFQPLKSFFDKITNRVFFRDAYDPQHVLHELGAILVRAGSRKEICAEVTSLLENDMKISRVRFLWTYGNGPHNLLSAPQATSRDSNEIHDENLAEDLRRHHSHTIIVDDLPLTSRNGLGEHLRQEDVSIVLQISTQRQRIGYLLLGGKRGGNVFTDPDVKLLETLAAELALAMQNALRYEEIANFNLALQSRVESATKELRQSNEKLKALDETKDDFISMASHQLRTPLTSVKGYLSLVIEGDAGQISEQQRKLLNQAFISSQRMVYLISDLLNVSRLRTGKFIIEPAPVNLSEVIEDEIAQLVETAESREITLKYDKPKEFPTLMLDETKTRQVIMNFIDNAIYYTPAGGRIDVHLVNKPTTVELKVVDNGIGVPKAEQHHLFTKFYRAKNARKARPDGTGLGLFMAKKVITAQGGAIVFDSQEDKGSTFGFTFSKSKLAVKPGAAAAPPQTVTVK
ncbi:MAG TPA: GAF domain-containing sensor histidine kinase, partial [Chroococcales cyanobacterium]